jgi:hypothetical protein
MAEQPKENKMTTRIKLRRDTAGNWASANPVLALGEPGFDTTNNEIRVGDGVTAWTSLDPITAGNGDIVSDWTDSLNDNVWRIATVKGTKQFDFETEGYKLLEYTFTSSQENLSSWTLSVDDYPELPDMWWNYNTEENSVGIYQGDADSGNLMAAGYNSYSNGVLTIGMDNYSFAAGDKMTIKYWTEGTRVLDMQYNTEGWLIPDRTETGLVNSVRIDATEFNIVNSLQNLTTNTNKHAITFKNNSRTFSRNITAVSSTDNLYTITFDGDPIAIKTLELQTVTTKAQNSGVDSTGSLEIPHSAIPDFELYAKYAWDTTTTNKYTGSVSRSGYLKINNGSPINFFFYDNTNGDNNNWQLDLGTASTWSVDDTIEIHWYRWENRIELDIYQPNTINSNWNNGYRWFDLKTDMPEYHAIEGNGITGGKGTVLCKTYTENRDDARYAQFHFAWSGNDNNSENDPYDPYKQQYIWNTDADNNPFYYFSQEDGMVYRSDWQVGGSFSRKLKVRMMYKFEFNITGEADYGWFNC